MVSCQRVVPSSITRRSMGTVAAMHPQATNNAATNARKGLPSPYSDNTALSQGHGLASDQGGVGPRV